MPPILPRKRLCSPSPAPSPSPPPKKSKPTPTRAGLTGAFADPLDNGRRAPTAAENRAFLDALEDEQSSLSEADSDSDEFEDVMPAPPAKRVKVGNGDGLKEESDEEDGEKDEDSEDDLDFEDVQHAAEAHLTIPEMNENFEVTVRTAGEGEHTRLTLRQGGKASITKKMRRARILAHCMHVQFLMWHNVIRNSWINDKEVHAILLKGLPESLKEEVKRWKVAMGYEKIPEKKGKSKKGAKGKTAQKSSRERIRDWGADAEKSEQGTQGDPLIRLLKYLASYWKKRFVVTAPSLRKLGYRHPREMRQEMDSFNDDPHDPSRHGERIAGIDEFRELAKKCKGSRDVGAQLFTALLRGLGIEARMVASLQATGFGWSKFEEAHPRKDASAVTTDAAATESDVSKATPRNKSKSKKKTSNGSTKGSSNRPINLDSDASSLSDSLSDDGISLSAVKPVSRPSPKRFDRDLLYPTYWTEALSPISNTYTPISTLLHPNVITSTEHIGNFEPRGAAAEKGKQVIAYVLAFSSDGSAKDVTMRYLRKRTWPGKTKGFRIPVEKVPVYDENGKVKRWEEYDWFKRVMRCYARRGKDRTLADEMEDEGDLVPAQPDLDEEERKKMKEPDTLQGYKQSADFVLERHLRREEALRPGTKPVKHFHVGKGEKATKEPVYKRTDVVTAKTVETWHKEGRQVKVGEQALKQVPYRAVTIQRKREIEDQTRDQDGVKPTQGLYAEFQTEWIIPDPIGPDRLIPKNAYNNIDVYVPSMVPQGAIHIPLKGTARVCKKLGIDFAEACTGFEFGKQRAVPVITGVVVAEENEDMVIDAWREEERIKREKEDKKREEKCLKLWKKFFRGLKVRDRIGREYGFADGDEDGGGDLVMGEEGGFVRDDVEPEEGGFVRDGDEDTGGGFLPDEGQDYVDPAHTEGGEGGGGFLPHSEEEENNQQGGDLEIIGGSQDPSKKRRRQHQHADSEDSGPLHQHLPTPISLQAMHAEQEDAESEDVDDATLLPGKAEAEAHVDVEMQEEPSPAPSENEDDSGDEYTARKKQKKSTAKSAAPTRRSSQKDRPKPSAKATAAKTKTKKKSAAESAASEVRPKRKSSRKLKEPTSSPYFSQ